MPETKRDFYEVLGVAREATGDDVKRAYRRLAAKFHPDKNKDDPQAEAKFKELAAAYEVLGDPEKRSRYDRLGHAGLEGVNLHDFSGAGVQSIFDLFGDIFGDGLFGGRRRGPAGQRVARGADLEMEVELTIEQIAAGVDKELRFDRRELCPDCTGSGAKPGTKPEKCATCAGQGRVQQRSGLGGFFAVVTDCPTCAGSGSFVRDKCGNCKGAGLIEKERVLHVDFRAGLREGQGVVCRGEGEPGLNGGPRGDLVCYVRVREHPFLQRHENDLVCRVPVSFVACILGGSVEVPTIAGKEKLDIPRGTQPGAVFRMAGKGLPDVRSGRKGDQIVQIVVELPKKPTAEQERILREFASTEASNGESLPETAGWLEKLRNFFKAK
jgi:molecular chaperone DnaJ